MIAGSEIRALKRGREPFLDSLANLGGQRDSFRREVNKPGSVFQKGGPESAAGSGRCPLRTF